MSSSLTSVCLPDMDWQDEFCKVSLPSSVQTFEFWGHSLFRKEAELWVEHLPSLSTIILCMQDCEQESDSDFDCCQELSQSACMPRLPRSLCHLIVSSRCVARLLEMHAQDCLWFALICSN